MTIQPFDTEDEAVEMANSTKYGLAASIFTNDLKKAHRVAGNLETGIVWINCWLLRDLELRLVELRIQELDAKVVLKHFTSLLNPKTSA